jgi:hypothetical protein
MLIFIFFNFMYLFSQNVSDKITYQYQQEYIANIIYNLCAIDVDDSPTDKLFVEQFIQEIKKKKIGSYFDFWLKPEVDRQRIYQFVLKEFYLFVAKQSYDLAYSAGVSDERANSIKDHVLNSLQDFLAGHQLFDLYNHYGILRDFKGLKLVELVKKLLNNFQQKN